MLFALRTLVFPREKADWLSKSTKPAFRLREKRRFCEIAALSAAESAVFEAHIPSMFPAVQPPGAQSFRKEAL